MKTTTAEKIKVMQAFEDGRDIRFVIQGGGCGVISKCRQGDNPGWNWEEITYTIVTPSPPPLYVNVYYDGCGELYCRTYPSRDVARQRASDTAVHIAIEYRWIDKD